MGTGSSPEDGVQPMELGSSLRDGTGSCPWEQGPALEWDRSSLWDAAASLRATLP